MATYHNAYTILSDVREGLNEYSTALVQGTATHGKFSNTFILKKINRAQRLLYAKLMIRIKGAFLTSYSSACSSGVFTLPWDFGQIVRFEDENGVKVYPKDVNWKPTHGMQGSDNVYYRSANTFVLMDTSVSATYKLWYYRKPREITMGAASGENTLASTAKGIADYYNGMIIEDISGNTYDTIDDYSAARVVDVDITIDSGHYYGIVSDLPEMFHPLIAPLAQMICKAEHPVSPEKPTQAEVALWKQELEDAITAFGHSQGDIPSEDIWTDFGEVISPGVNIPGQGYTIPG
jgi:hypothetical protein